MLPSLYERELQTHKPIRTDKIRSETIQSGIYVLQLDSRGPSRKDPKITTAAQFSVQGFLDDLFDYVR